jgi:hypothetical protein
MKKILIEGYFRKEGQIFKTWKDRYYVIYEDGELSYMSNNLEVKGNILINETSEFNFNVIIIIIKG